MKQTVFVVTYVDSGDSCDGKPRVLGIYKTKDEALEALKEDMDTYAGGFTEDDEVEINRDRWYVDVNQGCSTCEWNVEDCEIDLN